MRVVILGAGGLGSVLGGFLASTGIDVTLIGRAPHVAAIRQRGLRIVGRRGDILIEDRLVAVTAAAEARGPFDYLILAVKGKDTDSALAEAAPLRNAVATAFSVQNTIVKDGKLVQWLGRDRVIGASTIEGGTLVDPGVVRNHVTAKVTAYFGELDGRITPRVEAITSVFDEAGLPAEAVDCIEQVEWEKLAQIALAATWSVTALGAVPGSSFFEGMTVPQGAEYFVALAKELLSVYRAKGYTPMNFYAPLSRLKELDSLSVPDAEAFIVAEGNALREGNNTGYPSMYEDVLRRRKTEIDYMLGPYLHAADEFGVEVPTLRVAYNIVKTVDRFLT
jgi:2-dehydropantoate 2-reductase